MRFEEIVDRRDHPACGKNTKHRRDEFGTVLQPQCHPAARTQPQVLAKVIGQSVCLVQQLPVAHLLLPIENDRSGGSLGSYVSQGGGKVHTPTLKVLPVVVKSNWVG